MASRLGASLGHSHRSGRRASQSRLVWDASLDRSWLQRGQARRLGLAPEQDAGCATGRAAVARLRGSACVDGGSGFSGRASVAISKRREFAAHAYRPATAPAQRCAVCAPFELSAPRPNGEAFSRTAVGGVPVGSNLGGAMARDACSASQRALNDQATATPETSGAQTKEQGCQASCLCLSFWVQKNLYLKGVDHPLEGHKSMLEPGDILRGT